MVTETNTYLSGIKGIPVKSMETRDQYSHMLLVESRNINSNTKEHCGGKEV